MKKIRIKKFEEYQHYSTRGIIWIKLYLRLLDDIEFWKLDDWEKWLWVGLLLLAGKFNNDIPYNEDFLRSKLSIKTPKHILDTIDKFAKCNFVEIIDDNGEVIKQLDSNLIAQNRIDKSRIDKKNHCSDKSEPGISFSDYCKQVIDFLNNKTGRKYEPTSKSVQQLLKARFNEKRTIADVKLVIAFKNLEWSGDEKMCQYVRPSTLFRRSNFDEYIVAARQKLEKEKGVS